MTAVDQAAVDPVDLTAWWDFHDRGTHDRPRPGTRVEIKDSARNTGTVTYYEGKWNSHTFPVRLDWRGITGLYTTRDVVELGLARPAQTPAEIVSIAKSRAKSRRTGTAA